MMHEGGFKHTHTRDSNLRTYTDEALMARYVEGDQRAFNELFRRYQPLLERLLRPGLSADAKDVVQQTFLNLHRARGTFIHGSAFRPWLLTIAFNLKRQHFRQHFRVVDLDAVNLAESSATNAETSYSLRRVLTAFGKLSARERCALTLLCGGGHDSASAANKMKISLGALKGLVHRARRQLKPYR
jgi:RNA polymerase sigma-70 factor (ECF subfamily)